MPAQHAPTQHGPNDSVRALQRMRWCLSLAIVMLCVLAAAANAASEPTHTHAFWSALSRRVHSGRFSLTPSSTEPYSACGRPSVGHAACPAIVFPHLAAVAFAGAPKPAAAPATPSAEAENL